MVPLNDPLNKYLRQKFRHGHDLGIIIKPLPYATNSYDGLKYSPVSTASYLRINPGIRINNEVPLSVIDFWFSTELGAWSLLIEPVLVNKKHGEDFLGESYERAGLTARYENALLRYRQGNNILSFGRAPVRLGQSFNSSIILSGESPPFDHASAFIDFNLFKIFLFTGQLHSGLNDFGRFKRYIAGKRLIFKSESGRTMFSTGDLIMYTGINRSIELHYLNPFIPYFFADLEKEIERYPPGGVDNDNTMIFFDGRHVLSTQQSLYFELLVDDFQIDIKNRDSIVDALGVKLGMDGNISVGTTTLGYEAEYTRISGYTYITRGWFTNWEDRDIPLGYKYGPDCQSFFLMVDYWHNDSFLLSLSSEYVQKGGLSFNSTYDPYDKVGNPFPTRPVEYSFYLKPSVLWHAKYGIIEVGFDGDLLNNQMNTLYLKCQVIWGIGFD